MNGETEAVRKEVLGYLYTRFYESDDPHGEFLHASQIVQELNQRFSFTELLIYATLSRLHDLGLLEGKDWSSKDGPCWLYKINAFGLEEAEQYGAAPSDELVSSILSGIGSMHITDSWHKALERRSKDPDGAITSARTLLEDVCKHILDEEGIAYRDTKDDLPKLYRKVTEVLNLAPDQQTEKVFRQILGGCQAVVEGLGSIRSKIGDAHGKGQNAVKPSQRHAALAVNLAGAMSTFLIETWVSKSREPNQ